MRAVVPPWRLIDIGINLTDGMYHGKYHGSSPQHPRDMDDVIRRAASVGVKVLIITGGTLTESKSAIELAKKYNGGVGAEVGLKCYSTVGCHPTRCNELAKDPAGYVAGLKALIEENRADAVADGVVCAIGECGLDYDREHFCKRDVQLPGFLAQLDLAASLNLPLFLHNRNTGDDFTKIMEEHRPRLAGGGVVHSFTGSMEEMQQLARLGLFIGINGCSLKTDDNLAVAKAVPAELLCLETDAPWCDIRNTHASSKHLTSLSKDLVGQWPVVKKASKWAAGSVVKNRNEPMHMVEVLDVMASLRATDPLELANSVADNTVRAFPSIVGGLK